MKKLVLTSCGIIDERLKDSFYRLLGDRKIEELKLLYITVAMDGDPGTDKSWADEEFQTILDLGVKENNITEFKLDHELDFRNFGAIYMMGGNTFYLMKKLRENGWDSKIKNAIGDGIIYIGSSAGSVILGKSIRTAIGYDENIVNITDLEGLNMVDGLVIPHMNNKHNFAKEMQKYADDKIYTIEDRHGFVITDNDEKYY